MTQLESFDTQQAPLDGTLAAGLKWQTEYQTTPVNTDTRFVKVADTVAQADAPAQGGDGGGGRIGVKEILEADPKDLSPNLKTLQGLAQHFDKATDKGKALTEVKPEVEKTVSAADAAQTAAEKQYKTDVATLKPKFEAEQTTMKALVGALNAEVAKIPEANREHVGRELTLLSDDKTSPALRKAVEADLATYPGLVPAANKFLAEEKVAMPIVEQLKALQTKMEEATADPVLARMIYADMLEQSGDKAGAKKVQAEAAGLQMGLTIDQIHQLQQQQKQLDQK